VNEAETNTAPPPNTPSEAATAPPGASAEQNQPGHDETGAADEASDIPDDEEGPPTRKRKLIDDPDPQPSFCRLLPFEYQFTIVDKPKFPIPEPGPPRDEPAKPTTNPSISMLPCGYVHDRAASYWRDTVEIIRSANQAYIRLKHTGEGTYEIVDESGTVVSPHHVWFSEDYESHPNLPLHNAINEAVRSAYEDHDRWLEDVTEKWNSEKAEWRMKRLEWEATLCVNVAFNGGAKWQVTNGDKKILALGGYHRRHGDPEWTEALFNIIRDQIIAKANDIDRAPRPRDRPTAPVVFGLKKARTDDHGMARDTEV
jgi:hypothetical protein